jgi:hypothetical protein
VVVGFPTSLRGALDAARVRDLLEHTADRLGYSQGRCTIELEFDAGKLLRAYLKRWVGARGLEELARPGAPSLR